MTCKSPICQESMARMVRVGPYNGPGGVLTEFPLRPQFIKCYSLWKNRKRKQSNMNRFRLANRRNGLDENFLSDYVITQFPRKPECDNEIGHYVLREFPDFSVSRIRRMIRIIKRKLKSNAIPRDSNAGKRLEP